MTIYLDYLASTPCDPDVVDAMMRALREGHANPHSAQHHLGLKAAAQVNWARAAVAKLANCTSQELIFTSGATESNNLAIKGAVRHLKAQGDSRRRVITAATEHKCVLEACLDLKKEGFDVVILPVDRHGRVTSQDLVAALKIPTLLVSIMSANNETGVIQDIPELSQIARAHGALFHTDAAQILGKSFFQCGDVDLASFSAHKIYGPMGIGALYVRRRPRVRLMPLFSGGGQERGIRSGTVPHPLVVGFGHACQRALRFAAADASRLTDLRDKLQTGLLNLASDAYVNGIGAKRLPGALNICFKNGPKAQAFMALTKKLAYSSGSACASADIAPSYVLRAMGLSDGDASRSLRLSVGRFTSSNDVASALNIFESVLRPS